MADPDRVLSLTIKAYTEKAVKDFDNAITRIRRDLDEYVKQNRKTKDVINENTQALDKNTHAIKRRREEIQKVTNKERELDKTSQGRVDRLEKETEAYYKQQEQLKELDEARIKQAEIVKQREIDNQHVIARNFDVNRDRQRQEIENSEEYIDNLHDIARAENDLLDARIAYQEEYNKIHEQAIEEFKVEEMERVRAAQDVSEQIAQIRRNVERSRGTTTTDEALSRPLPVGDRDTRRTTFERGEVDSSWNERLAASLRSKFTPAFNKATNAVEGLKDAISQGNEWAEGDSFLQKLARSSGETSKAMKQLEWRLAKLGRTMLGLVIASVLIFMQSFASILVAVGAQAIAVVGSIGAAASAIGGTLVSAIAQAIPMLGIFAAAMQRVSLVQDAVGAFDALKQDRASQQGGAEEANAAKEAADAISDAQKQQQDAVENLTEARAEARRELEDLIVAEKEANLAVQDAILTQKEAKQQLEDAIQEGDVGGIDRAQLAVAEARLGLSSARTTRDRASEDLAKAQRGGISQMETVVAATDQLAAANEALADAQEQATEATTAQSAASDNLNYYLSQLTDSEKELYHAIVNFRERLEDEFTPITDNIIEAFTYGIKGAEKLIFNNRIMKGLESLSKGMERSMKNLIDVATSRQSIEFWEEMTAEAKRNLEPLEDILTNVYRILRSIAQGAAPVFHRLLKLIAEETEGWADSLRGNRRGIEDFFQNGLRHLRAWGRLLKGIINLFGALMEVSGPSAIRTLDGITGKLNEGAENLRDNSKEARAFFNQTSRALGILWGAVEAIGEQLIKAFDIRTVRVLAEIIADILAPALGIAMRAMGRLAILFHGLPDWVKDVIKFATAFVILKGTLGIIFNLFLAILGPLGGFLTRLFVLNKILGMLGISTGALGTAMGVLGTVIRTVLIASGIGLLIGAIVLLLHKLGVLDDVWNWVKNAAVDAWDAIKNAAQDVAKWFSDNFGDEFRDLARSLSGLWDTLKDRWANVWDGITFVVKKVVDFFKEVFAGRGGIIGGALRRFWDFTKGILKGVFDFIKGTIENVLKAIGGFIKIIDGILSGDFGKIWDGIKQIAEAGLDQILNLLDYFTQPFEEAGKALGSAFGNAFEGAITFIREIVTGLLDFILGGFSTLLSTSADVIEEIPNPGGILPFDPDEIAGGLRGAADVIDGARESLRTWGDDTEKAEDKTRGLGNTYRNTADRAEELAKKTKEGAKATKQASDKDKDRGDVLQTVNKITKRAIELTKDLKNEDKVHAKGINHLGNEYRNTSDRAQQLGERTKDNTKETKRNKDEIKALNRFYRDAGDLSKKLGDQTEKTTKRTKDQGDESKRTGKKVNTLSETFFGAGKQTKELAEVIKDATNKALSAFGAKKLEFSVPKVSKVFSDVGGAASGFQTGGWFGNPNLRGPDDRLIKVAGGEAILTGHQQKAVNMGLAYGKAAGAVPYGSLDELFNREQRPHSTAPIERFARGGSVSLSGAHATVSAFVSKLMSKFGGSVGSGLRAYDSGSLHSTGQAIDYSPSNWAGASRAVNAIGPSLLEGIYNPGMFGGQAVSWDNGQQVSPGFWGSSWGQHLDHIHIAIADGTKAIKGAMLGAAAELKKIKIKGPEGRLKDGLQGMADKLRDAANKELAKHGGIAGMDIVGKGAKIGDLPKSLMQFNKIFAEHNSADGDYGGYVMPKKYIAALAEWVGTPGWTMEYITRGESGGRPGATGIDPGGTKGLGLWMITTGYNDAIIAKLGGEAAMRNPILNAIAMKSIYDSQGLGAWYAAHPANTNQHYTGNLLQRGGKIPEFDDGGVVPGPKGKKRLVFAHGGETFVPTHKESFAKGGPVRQAFAAIEDIFEIFSSKSVSKDDREKDNWRAKWKEDVLDAIEDLLRDGGAFDDLMTAIEEQIVNLENNLQTWQLRVRKKGVVNIRTFKEIANKTLDNLIKVGNSYSDQMDNIREAMRVVERRIRKSKDVKERQKWRAALEKLEDTQRELQGTINENLTAQLDQQNAIWEAILARYEQMLTRVDSLRTIAELRAQIREDDPEAEADPEVMRRLYRRTRGILRRERRSIRKELREARRGGDIERTRELRQAMLDNRIALMENTVALNETKDSIQKTFSFNTTPWQMFRQAILDGSGGLIPQLRGTIPSLASGGRVISSGLVNLHAGEVVTNPDSTPHQDIKINFTEPMEVADPEAVSSAIAWKLKTQV